MKKPFLCRLGFHQVFFDTVLTNYGNDDFPMWFGTTYDSCNRCEWTTQPKDDE